MLILLDVRLGFSTLKILATVKQCSCTTDRVTGFSTLKILATVKPQAGKLDTDTVLVPLRF